MSMRFIERTIERQLASIQTKAGPRLLQAVGKSFSLAMK